MKKRMHRLPSYIDGGNARSGQHDGIFNGVARKKFQQGGFAGAGFAGNKNQRVQAGGSVQQGQCVFKFIGDFYMLSGFG